MFLVDPIKKEVGMVLLLLIIFYRKVWLLCARKSILVWGNGINNKKMQSKTHKINKMLHQ